LWFESVFLDSCMGGCGGVFFKKGGGGGGVEKEQGRDKECLRREVS